MAYTNNKPFYSLTLLKINFIKMIKKLKFIGIALMLVLVNTISFGQIKESVEIDGRIIGLKKGEKINLKILEKLPDGGSSQINFSSLGSCIATNNHFSIKVHLPEGPRLLLFDFSNHSVNQNFTCFFDNGEKITIEGNLDKSPEDNIRDYLSITGSPSDFQYSLLKYCVIQFANLSDNDAQRYLQTIKDSIGSNSEVLKVALNVRKYYLKGLYVILDAQARYNHNKAIPLVVWNGANSLIKDPEELIKLYGLLDEKTKKSYFGKLMKDMLSLIPGQTAPGFQSKTIEGKPFVLEDFVKKNSYTLIDFWASYCKPCRAENPNLIKLYSQYNKQGFNIVSVDLDTNPNSWQMAVQKDGLSWAQISDLKGASGEAAVKYGANNGIPRNVLLDRDGKVIAWNLYGVDLQQKLNKLFAENK